MTKTGFNFKTKGKPAKNRVDLTGKTIGWLKVIKPHKNEKCPKKIYWECECKCGNTKIICSSTLTRKKQTKSCGCLRVKRLHDLLWTGHGEISGSYWNGLFKDAKIRNLDFKISIKEGWELFLKQNRKCGLSGVDLTFSPCVKKKRELQTASLDRIDSSKGYTIDNLMWVHKEINILKSKLENPKLIYWCKLIANHNKNYNIQ